MGFTTKPYDHINLMSPPETSPCESFDSVMTPTSPLQLSSSINKPTGPNAPLSPPNSPSPKPSPLTQRSVLSNGITDPILYPPNRSASPPTRPLFIPAAEARATSPATTEKLVEDHIKSRPASLFRGLTPPKPEEYALALFFQSRSWTMFQQNPAMWLRREKELLREDRKNIAMSRPMPRLPPILPASRPAAPRPTATRPQVLKPTVSGIQKPKCPTKTRITAPRPIRATPVPSRQNFRVSATPEPRVRTVAPNREDKDFKSLPNYCPPLDSLPNKPNSLKVDWKGTALDLSNDPHANLLHPDELHLAGCLRLDCATYLTSKRRIFMRRRDCVGIKKEFRKTDAQQACKIDVNKASKLWTAYERVGWLDERWMKPFLKD
ncbi:hypothetical protein B0T22DRAFT_497584 [Podospora appendiculata]|uniref:SWIRM domain-containing protein n=1 Tax=Podospora appendiculata TaxID=314037 RepID=A0AAE0XLT7_9PEZI|nr:hypothetical protein B0T22DRAFT_497584 [Podospora appendiculata]